MYYYIVIVLVWILFPTPPAWGWWDPHVCTASLESDRIACVGGQWLLWLACTASITVVVMRVIHAVGWRGRRRGR